MAPKMLGLYKRQCISGISTKKDKKEIQLCPTFVNIVALESASAIGVSKTITTGLETFDLNEKH